MLQRGVAEVAHGASHQDLCTIDNEQGGALRSGQTSSHVSRDTLVQSTLFISMRWDWQSVCLYGVYAYKESDLE